jgi:hypothetical protein
MLERLASTGNGFVAVTFHVDPRPDRQVALEAR